MIYLANPCSPVVRLAMRAGLLGMIDTPAQGQDVDPEVTWCADNGCYGKGYPGDAMWLRWLVLHAHQASTALFATAPDVVGDAAATLARSAPWLPAIRALGFPAALVAQDGLENLQVPWDTFDVLFIGGTTDWKLGPAAQAIVAQALGHGKHVHMGRVNSLKRLRYAEAIGCHSVDGTLLTFGPDKHLPPLLRWLAALPSTPAERRSQTISFLDDLAGTPSLDLGLLSEHGWRVPA